jgi:hypothetical protein
VQYELLADIEILQDTVKQIRLATKGAKFILTESANETARSCWNYPIQLSTKIGMHSQV